MQGKVKVINGNEKTITLDELKEMNPGIFAIGEAIDSQHGINMSNSGRLLRWVAVRGRIPDWSIYVGPVEACPSEIARTGDKIFNRSHIQKCVPCDHSALAMYRD
jgi:hypothetical protein